MKTIKLSGPKSLMLFMLLACTVCFSSRAWADSDSTSVSVETTTTSVSASTDYTTTNTDYTTTNSDLNGGPNYRGYTDKSYHASDGRHIYKHPEQPSYTSPFDYGSRQLTTLTERVIVQQQEGKCNCFTFDATKSYDIDGQKLTVMWDFGDGTTSDQAIVTHCFDKAGTYNVTLTVRDSSGMICDTGVASTKVDASFPATANAGPNKEACVGETITFNATSGEGTGPYNYKWDFGDGETGTGMTVSHAYQKAGQYRAILTVDDGKNTKCSVAQATVSARIYENAFVSLKGSESACIGQTVTFDGQGSGGKYRWDYGDGQTWEGGSRASHSYEKAGSYSVSVNVDDGRGSTCSSASAVTKILIGQPPIAKIADIVSCLTNEPINFDGSGSQGSNLSYRWDFGDGETAEGARVSHGYKKAGSYRVMLTVNDSSGSACGSANASVTAIVNTRPEAVIEVR